MTPPSKPSQVATTAPTHLIWDGTDDWIEAKRVWIEYPHPEVDGVEDGWGWQFKNAADTIRWLSSPSYKEPSE